MEGDTTSHPLQDSPLSSVHAQNVLSENALNVGEFWGGVNAIPPRPESVEGLGGARGDPREEISGVRLLASQGRWDECRVLAGRVFRGDSRQRATVQARALLGLGRPEEAMAILRVHVAEESEMDGIQWVLHLLYAHSIFQSGDKIGAMRKYRSLLLFSQTKQQNVEEGNDDQMKLWKRRESRVRARLSGILAEQYEVGLADHQLESIKNIWENDISEEGKTVEGVVSSLRGRMAAIIGRGNVAMRFLENSGSCVDAALSKLCIGGHVIGSYDICVKKKSLLCQLHAAVYMVYEGGLQRAVDLLENAIREELRQRRIVPESALRVLRSMYDLFYTEKRADKARKLLQAAVEHEKVWSCRTPRNSPYCES